MIKSVELNREDYLQGNAIHRKCLKLLTSTTGKAQKTVIGDNRGSLKSFGIQKGEVKWVFQEDLDQPIASLALSSSDKGNRIFCCCSTQVLGFTKKGKQFLSLKPSSSEHLQSIHVAGVDLLACGNHTFTHFRDCVDFNYFWCNDTISDVVCLPEIDTACIRPVIACHDRMIRVFKEKELQYEVEVPGKPSVLERVPGHGDDNQNLILYGTLDGRVGKVRLDESGPCHLWELENPKRKGGVTSLDSYDLTSDGVLDLVVARDNGQVELYSQETEGRDGHVLKFQKCFEESITNVTCGKVASSQFDEVLCSSFAGCVFGLSTKPRTQPLHHGFTKEGVASIKKLRVEIKDLQQQVKTERDNYYQAMEKGQDEALSILPPLEVHDSFELDGGDGCYVLALNLESPIDNVLLQSDVPLDILNSENSAVVSFSSCKVEDGNLLLATFRCQANVTRLEMRIRTIEGHSGTLQAYIMPCLQPKMCRVMKYPIKPLSLHRRCHSVENNRPFNLLTLRGQLSVSDVHAWLSMCIADMPDKAEAKDTCCLMFESVWLGTQFSCVYRRGEATFRSDNVSTIAIIKDVITREATKAKCHLDISFELNQASVPHALTLVHPHLEHQVMLAKKIQVLQALRELHVGEEERSFMAQEYLDILDEGEKLEEQYRRQPCQLERLYGLLTDLYIDKFKFQGQNVKGRVPELLKVLEKCDLSKILEFFDNP